MILDVKGSKANKLAFCKLIHEEISRAGKALRVLTKEISDSKMENLSYTPEPNAFYINQPIPEAMTGLFKAFIAIYTSPSISVKHVKMSDLNGHYICGPNENDLANFKDKLDSIIDSIFTNSGANTNRMKR